MSVARGFLSLGLVLLFACTASATHFRYGTVKWVPTGVQNEAEFELKAAFRKDYNWGAFFKEKWRDLEDGTEWKNDLGIAPALLPCDDPEVAARPGIQCFGNTAETYVKNYEILFPTGMGVAGHDLVPNNDTLDYYIFPPGINDKSEGKVVNPAADAENTGGKICECRFHKGVADADIPCPEAYNSQGEVIATGYDLAKSAGLTAPSFSLGEIGSGDPTKSVKTCTPWSEVFGFFYGDGTFNSDGVVLQVTNIDFEDTLMGNFFRGTSKTFTHTYPAAYPKVGQPYTAFFTGGNRITTLNNNADGRYRLEINVWFRSDYPDNASPISSMIPLLPVPYTPAPGLRFQVPAYDPDPEDSVRFFLSTQAEMGGLLANPDNTGGHAWHIDVYRNNICSEKSGPAVMCIQSGLSGLDLEAASQYVQVNTPFKSDWNDDDNLPHTPPDISIDPVTGVVTWRTGDDMNTPDADGYGPLPTGFYNLVVMVEERKPKDNDGLGIRNNQVKVPIDFLLYLYPPMHYCNMDCDNTPTGPILQTMVSRDGLYGDSSVGGTYPLSGTGKCKICGGGGMYLSTNDTKVRAEDDDVLFYGNSLNNGTVYCNVPNIATGEPIETCCLGAATPATSVEYGFVSNPDFIRPPTPGHEYQGCLGAAPIGAAPESIVPYSGIYDVCNVNMPPYFLTPATTPTGASPLLGTNSPPFEPAYVSYNLGQSASFTLEAYDDDECVEIILSETGMLVNMELGPAERIEGREADGIEPMKSVRRQFTWNPYKTEADGTLTYTDSAEEDEREQYSVTCFFASDSYLLTTYPFHCIKIELLQPTTVGWCDTPPLYDNPPIGQVYTTYLNEEVCIDLCVKKSLTNTYRYNVGVRAITTTVPGVAPIGPGFDFPYDDLNYPMSAGFTKFQDPDNLQDPFVTSYCFTPGIGEECVFVVCFEGVDSDTIPGTDATPEEVTADNKCYKIEVYNRVLLFDEDADLAEVTWLTESLTPSGGLTASLWAKPKCGGDVLPVNETLIVFGSNRDIPAPNGILVDDGLTVRNSIIWSETETGIGSFIYFDEAAGDFPSKVAYQCDLWHYIAFTINEDNTGTLFVDGALRGYDTVGEIDTHIMDAVPIVTPSRPDSHIDGDDTTGFFKIGSGCHLGEKKASCSYAMGFNGHIDEVRVWDYALTAAQIDEDMFSRLPDPTAVLELSMVPSSLPDVLAPSIEIQSMAYPVLTPCVVGMEHYVGPTVGGCDTMVYGWGFSESTWLKCAFDDQQVPATFVSPTVMTCETPGTNSPQFMVVTASNNGAHFTNNTLIGKDTKHLFMDSVLYTDGGDAAGAAADAVCHDLEDAEQVSFGGWFCPKCGPPPS
eukprot:CAMPEP_0197855464 /NCGR_PEP_ID=MMETSP1438-20131217/26697_1 /TAXON_ID=1461541 /ORGANISM="Pterosperma sp., Strain CCMP1384" /LENGTH=1343 /DNA_ID=CAMNT_0043470583 /DNA_START=38 /DNA_END=4069 /DNA_ORIENTATION=+